MKDNILHQCLLLGNLAIEKSINHGNRSVIVNIEAPICKGDKMPCKNKGKKKK